MLIRWRELKNDNCTKCTTTTSSTLFCVCNRTRTTVVPAPMFLQTWNRFEIDLSYDNNQTRQQIIGDLIKLQTTLFDVLAINNVSFTPLYKGVKTWRMARLIQQFKSAKTLLKLFHIKVHLEFLINFHILEILEF